MVCPICGGRMTQRATVCQSCFGTAEREVAAQMKAGEDRELIQAIAERGQAAIARERGVSRQAIFRLFAKARKRQSLLDQMEANE